jgi:hypothetical protein
LFISIPYVVHWSGLARIDLLALAFSLGGVYLLIQSDGPRWKFFAGAGLLVAAIFTRQSYALAAPAGAFLYIFRSDRKKALTLAAIVAGFSLLLVLLLQIATRGGFYFNIVTANQNEFGLDRLEDNARRFWEIAEILFVVAVFSLALVRTPTWFLAAPYLIGAALSGLTIGKIGSNVNYWLELCAGLSMSAGAVVAWSRGEGRSRILSAGLLLLLGVHTGQLMRATLSEYWNDLQDRRAAAAELSQLEKILAEVDGPVLADEYMGLVTLKGDHLTLQPFELTQLANQGLWDQTPLLESIRAKEFPLILIHFFPFYDVYKERWSEEMLAAINRSYRPVGSYSDTRVYRPLLSGTPKGESCQGFAWRLPSNADMGVRWSGGGLEFFGRGQSGGPSVRAVADGKILRKPDWLDAVAILHEDPLRPGEVVFTYYEHMADAHRSRSFVDSSIPLGVESELIEMGDVLGRQGTWSGQPGKPAWMHVRFAVVKPDADGAFPEDLTPDSMLDPRPYLGIDIKAESESSNLQPFICLE